MKSLLLKIIYFIILICLMSFIKKNNLNHNKKITKKKYKKIFSYNEINYFDTNEFPPTLTDLNDIWKLYDTSMTNKILINKVIQKAKKYIGTPYKYGGESIHGIDCSALVKQSFKPYKFLPRVSFMQAKSGIHISKNKIMKGDLVFFFTKKNHLNKKISHVGIVIKRINNKIFFIHASSSSGVKTSLLENSYWKKKFVTARRIFNDTNLKKNSFSLLIVD